jgi:hypothetical protein
VILATSVTHWLPAAQEILQLVQRGIRLSRHRFGGLETDVRYQNRVRRLREIVPGERRIEIRQRLEGEDINLHLFAIRVLEDEMRYEVKLSGDTEHKTVKPPEWLSLLHDKLARIVAKILYARETSKPEKQDLDLSGPAA